MLRTDAPGAAAAGDEPLDPDAELRALRARAYGPDADIEADPAALRRLRQLEAGLTERTPAPPDGAHRLTAAERSAPAPDPVAAPPPVVHAAPPSDVPPTAGPSASRGRGRRGRPRRATLLWLAATVVVALVSATVAWAVTRRVEADPEQVAVLGVNPDQRIPTVFGVEQNARRYTDYLGLTVVALLGRGWLGGAPDDYCLLVMDSSRIEWRTNSYTGEMYGGCGAGDFPATVQLRIVPGLPEELVARFPAGSALQFVLAGDEVVVLSDRGGEG